MNPPTPIEYFSRDYQVRASSAAKPESRIPVYTGPKLPSAAEMSGDGPHSEAAPHLRDDVIDRNG